jgi:glycine cleavage system pyridoxal-binding protein P
MRYLPHTREDISDMLKKIGVDSLDDLFTSIVSARGSNQLRSHGVRRLDETIAARKPCLAG